MNPLVFQTFFFFLNFVIIIISFFNFMKHIFVIKGLTLTFVCSLDGTLTMDQFEGVCVFFPEKYLSL
jgi:hypothetical protein